MVATRAPQDIGASFGTKIALTEHPNAIPELQSHIPSLADIPRAASSVIDTTTMADTMTLENQVRELVSTSEIDTSTSVHIRMLESTTMTDSSPMNVSTSYNITGNISSHSPTSITVRVPTSLEDNPSVSMNRETETMDPSDDGEAAFTVHVPTTLDDRSDGISDVTVNKQTTVISRDDREPSLTVNNPISPHDNFCATTSTTTTTETTASDEIES